MIVKLGGVLGYQVPLDGESLPSAILIIFYRVIIEMTLSFLMYSRVIFSARGCIISGQDLCGVIFLNLTRGPG